MAISLVQQPSTITDNKFIHGSTYPTYYTATSDNATMYSDFKYVFTTTATEGVIGRTKNNVRQLENLGAFDSQPIVRPLVSSMFQPTINTWTTCSDSIRQYRVDIQEFYNGVTQSSVTNYTKSIIFKQNKEDFLYSNYLLNEATKKMLTEKTGITPIRRTDFSTMRFLNASMFNTTYAPYISQPYSILFQLFTGNGQESFIYSWHYPNPFWYTGIPILPSSTLDAQTTISKRLIEIPTGPANLSGSTLDLIWIIGADGTSIAVTPGYATPGHLVFNMTNITHYDVWAYTYPLGDVSIKYRYKFECENVNKPSIQLQWENNCGGIDSFLFTKVNTKTNSISSNVITKNKYQQGHATTYTGNRNQYIGYNSYDRGTEQIFNEQTTTYTLNSDLLTQAQCNDLESLWNSNFVFANIGGTYRDFYPVISMSEAVVIKTTKGGLRQYSFDIQFSNKKINL